MASLIIRNLFDGKTADDISELNDKDIEKFYMDYIKTAPSTDVFSIFESLMGQPKPDMITNFIKPVLSLILTHIHLIYLQGGLHADKKQLNKLPQPVSKRIEKFLLADAKQMINLFFYDATNLLAIYYVEGIAFVENEKRTIRSDLDVISKKWSGRGGQVLLPSFCIENSQATEDNLSLSLANINLIDTSKATWDQIIDFRKDDEARKKIRNLRLFIYENYQEKSLSYIEDDLGKRLDEYYDTCKDWGFDTLTSTISAVMDAKNLISLLVGSTCATLFGGPVAGLLTGTAIELSKISLNITKRKYAFNKLKRTHDLAFIIEAKKKLE